MGYRMYLAKAPKDANLTETVNEFDDTYTKISDQVTSLHELGKYVEWRMEGAKNLMCDGSKYPDKELYIVDRDFLIYLIDEYRKLTHQYYSQMFEMAENLQKITEDNEPISDDLKTKLSIFYTDMRSKANYEWKESSISAVSINLSLIHI